MESFVAVRDGATLFSHDGPDYVIMHPSGDWGISYFTGSEVEKIILNGTEMQTEPWAFPEVDMISSIRISEDHIFVAGGAVENNEHTIFVYDLSGVLQTKLGGTEFGEDDSLGSVTAVVETANGYMALDGNMRTVLFWAPDGTFIGSAEDSDLFGCALPGFVDSKNEEKTERNAGYLVVSHSGGGMLRQGTRKGIRRTPANRGMRAHWVVKGLDISEDVCHGMCP